MKMTECFDVGVRVIIDFDYSYGGRFSGERGVIDRIYDERVLGVKLDNHTNESSRYGIFWFEEKCLAVDKTEDYIMFGNYKRAEIVFLDEGRNSGSVYHYALFDGTATVGDMVVVSTGHHGLALAKIVAVSDDNLKLISCGREVVARVDTSAFSARKAREIQLTQLKKKMDQRVRQVQQFAVYEALAGTDAELKAMFEEWKNLTCAQ